MFTDRLLIMKFTLRMTIVCIPMRKYQLLLQNGSKGYKGKGQQHNSNKNIDLAQKRKLLWGNKSSDKSFNQWDKAKFSQDTDGAVQSKFLRLMGAKNVDASKPNNSKDDQVKSRKNMFSNMQEQYDVARQTTHTMRGCGLGFSSNSRQW